MDEYAPAKKRTEVTVGESVRILRELQELSQNELARRTGIAQSTLSAIDRFGAPLPASRLLILATHYLAQGLTAASVAAQGRAYTAR